LGCLALLVIAGMMLFPVFARPRYKSSNNCLSNIKQLMLAEIMYASDNHERFPSAQDWPRQLYPYVKNSQIYVCPSDPSPRQYPYEPREQSYTMNLAANELDSTRFVAPASLVVIFDGNSLYGLTAAAAFRHNDGANVGFADGHAKWVARQSFTVDLLQPPGLQGRPLSPWAPAASGWGGGGPP
jgi:prepilin-type processing-associated H-X9-DG protein